MAAPSYNATTHLNTEELVILLACMHEVILTDVREDQEALRNRLTKLLRKKDADLYDELVAADKIAPVDEPVKISSTALAELQARHGTARRPPPAKPPRVRYTIETWNQPAGRGQGWMPCSAREEDATWFVFKNGQREQREFKNRAAAQSYIDEQKGVSREH